MYYHRLKNTAIEISAIGLGAWPLSSGYDWSNAERPDVASILSAAKENGINFIDTAPIYEGSEAALGNALKDQRKSFVLATKCGLVKKGSWPIHDLHNSVILAQLEDSLRALQTDYIDLYQIHYADPAVPLEEALEVLTRCKEQGKIRAIGVCNMTARQLQLLSPEVTSVQNEYSLLHPQQGEEVFQMCQEKQISFIAYGTLCGGILSGKYKQAPNFRRADARNYFYKCYRAEAFEKAQQLVVRLTKMALEKDIPTSALASAWALSHPLVNCALTGAKTAVQIVQNARGANIRLTRHEREYLAGNICKK